VAAKLAQLAHRSGLGSAGPALDINRPIHACEHQRQRRCLFFGQAACRSPRNDLFGRGHRPRLSDTAAHQRDIVAFEHNHFGGGVGTVGMGFDGDLDQLAALFAHNRRASHIINGDRAHALMQRDSLQWAGP
jgi:hypothetical protein